jgi:Group II intron, maturase-specific domain
LLANTLLDEVDKELEKRGLAFCRYADDLNVYTRSKRAAEDAMQTPRGLFTKLRLQSTNPRVPWLARGKALEAMKERVRVITSRTRGRSIPFVIAELRPYLLGWKEYFKLQERTSLFRELDGWIRHRLRMLHLKHWKNGPNAYRELRARGLPEQEARKVAGNLRSWWRNSHMAQSGTACELLRPPRLAEARCVTSTFRTAGCGPACPVVWEGSGGAIPATPIPISRIPRTTPRRPGATLAMRPARPHHPRTPRPALGRLRVRPLLGRRKTLRSSKGLEQRIRRNPMGDVLAVEARVHGQSPRDPDLRAATDAAGPTSSRRFGEGDLGMS